MNLLDYICEGVDLSGVEIIEQDRRFIKQARKDVETQAHKMLEQGMETQVSLSRFSVELNVRENYDIMYLCIRFVLPVHVHCD